MLTTSLSPRFAPRSLMLVTMLLIFAASARAQTTAITYQGRLTDAGASANGQFDLQFKLFNIVSAGAQQGATIVRDDVQVANGVFTVTLDFGTPVFTTTAGKFLEIGVRPGASGGDFILLAPRQPITASPYSIQTINAERLGGVGASQYVQTNDARLTDARQPAAGSANYIQNTTTQQTGNFNISGNGTVGGTLTGNGIATGIGVRGNSFGGTGVFGFSTAGTGTRGESLSGTGVDGISSLDGVMGQGGRFGVWGIGNGSGVRGESTNGTGTGVDGRSTDGSGVLGTGSNRGSIALRAEGTSWFHGDTTALKNTSGAGIAIGSLPGVGYIFAYDYGANAAQTLSLNNPGGRVGIGTTTPDQTLTVNGNASKTAGGGSWVVPSDERLKNIQGRYTPGLRAVMQLQPIRYQYKPDNVLGIKTAGEQVGFGAQAVERIIPEAVIRNAQGYRMINNDPILWTMLNAIKEQQAQIERQARLLKQQQRQIDRLMKISVNRRRK